MDLNSLRFRKLTEDVPEVALMNRFTANSDLGDSLGKATTAFSNLCEKARSRPRTSPTSQSTS